MLFRDHDAELRSRSRQPPVDDVLEQTKAAPPTRAPRIDPSTPISARMICVRAVIDSAAGGCIAGRIVLRTDPLVAAAPSCFLPRRIGPRTWRGGAADEQDAQQGHHLGARC